MTVRESTSPGDDSIHWGVNAPQSDPVQDAEVIGGTVPDTVDREVVDGVALGAEELESEAVTADPVTAADLVEIEVVELSVASEVLDSSPVVEARPIPADDGHVVQAEAVTAARDIDAPPNGIAEQVEVVPQRSLPFAFLHGVCSVAEWTFGLFSLIAILAVLAAIPVVQFISLGYLLEASGSVARTGRLRNGLVGIRVAARIGSIVAGTWLCLLPVNYLSDLWYASSLIDPASSTTHALRVAQLIVTVLMVAHILAAWYCGGKLRYFFWPFIAPFSMVVWFVRWSVAQTAVRRVLDATLGAIWPRLVRDICRVRPLTDWFLPAIVLKGLLSGRLYTRARDAVWDFVTGLELPYYFWLGLRGFVGALVWLVLPVMLIATAMLLPPGPSLLLTFLGVVLMSFATIYLPFLLAHFAAERRFGALFEIGEVRRLYRRAPIAFSFALLITLALAVPLYLAKIEFAPQELTWALCLAFIALILPGRLLTGWAIGRGRLRHKPRFFLWRWSLRPAMFALGLSYSTFLTIAVYVLWSGTWSLFEQHAFQLPVPFFFQ